MAKTKAVKQAEAKSRALVKFNNDRIWYEACLPGGASYIWTIDRYGKEATASIFQRAETVMLASAIQANVDRDGNPLIKSILAEKRITKRTPYRNDALDAQCIPGFAANPDKIDNRDEVDMHWYGYQD